MEIRKASISEMFGWLNASFRLVGKNPAKFALASVLSLVILFALVIAIVFASFGTGGASQFIQPGYQPEIKTMLYLYAAMILFGVFLMPPFLAGWLMLCRNLATTGAGSATDIFTVYSSSSMWKKLIQYCLVSLFLYIAVHAVYILTCIAVGISIHDFGTVLIPKPGSDPLAVLSLGAGFWFAYIGLILVGMFLQQMLLLGFSQAALTDSGVIDSLKAGIAGILKNLLRFIAFFLLAILAMTLALIVVALLIGLIVAAIALLHSTIINSIGIVLIAVLYIALILLIYPVMFSFNYFTWKGILGKDDATKDEPAISTDTELLI